MPVEGSGAVELERERLPAAVEQLTIDSAAGSVVLRLEWDTTGYRVPFTAVIAP
jgi:hypothetical protein